MHWNIVTRKVHYWSAIVVAAPFLIVICTGILLQLKKQLDWVQPATQRGASKTPTVTFAQILDKCRGVKEANIQSWADIERLDVQPSRGLVKVKAQNSWEIQLDIGDAKILQIAYRRSDLIEAIHDGSWFHDAAKLWIFLPAAIIVLGMWLTGMYLFFLPLVVKWRRRRKSAVAALR